MPCPDQLGREAATAAPWEPVTPVKTTQTLRAHSFGVPAKFIDGVTIQAGDQFVISEVPTLEYVQTAGAVVRIEIDGVPWQVVGVTDIPAAGVRAAVRFQVRR